MNVTQFLARLSYGPLSNIAMSNDGDGTIAVGRHPALINYINEGLLRLYSRFILNEKELIIEEQEGRTSYRIHSDFSMSTIPLPDPAYIRDHPDDLYTNDLIKILEVYRDNADGLAPTKVGLNDANVDNSVYTPQFDVLQIPEPVQDAPLYLIYQARHSALATSGDSYLDQIITIPDVLEEALIAFVAHKVYFYMNGQEHAAKAAEHLSNFEGICMEVKDKDLVNSSVSNTNTKFNMRGFV